jgi:hypothetical protein
MAPYEQLCELYRALPGTPTDQILRWRRERIESEMAARLANPRRILIIRP